MGPLYPGRYNITVEGLLDGNNIFNTTELKYVHKSYSVFIQCDKAIYRPGETVRYRVILVNSQLQPSVTGAIQSIYIAVSSLHIVHDIGGN